MKFLAFSVACILPAVLLAQEVPGARPSPTPAVSYPVSAFSLPPPDEGSVFFAERQDAKFTLSSEGQARLAEDEVAEYPRAKGSPDSVTTMFTRFFTDMFASIQARAAASGTDHRDSQGRALKILPRRASRIGFDLYGSQ